VLEPSVLLFDEPVTTSMPPATADAPRRSASCQQALGLTVVYVTHDQQEAMAVSDRIIVMNAGRIEQQGCARTL